MIKLLNNNFKRIHMKCTMIIMQFLKTFNYFQSYSFALFNYLALTKIVILFIVRKIVYIYMFHLIFISGLPLIVLLVPLLKVF